MANKTAIKTTQANINLCIEICGHSIESLGRHMIVLTVRKQRIRSSVITPPSHMQIIIRAEIRHGQLALKFPANTKRCPSYPPLKTTKYTFVHIRESFVICCGKRMNSKQRQMKEGITYSAVDLLYAARSVLSAPVSLLYCLETRGRYGMVVRCHIDFFFNESP